MPIAEAWARPFFSGASRAMSLPAGRTRRSLLYLSLSTLPTATAMLKPDVPVSYAVIVSVSGSFMPCADAPVVAIAAASATPVTMMDLRIMRFLPWLK